MTDPGQSGAAAASLAQAVPTPTSSSYTITLTTTAPTTTASTTVTSASAPAPRPVASLRLPPFSSEETELWLSQVECALGVAGVTDDLTRYQVLVVNLPTEVAVQVRDVIGGPSPSYAALTTALRDRLAQSKASRLEALLRHQQLGDQRPSELLRRMQGELAMAGITPAEDGLLRTLYKQRLPQPARAALSLLPEATPLADLASAADRFLEASAAAPSQPSYPAASQPVYAVQSAAAAGPSALPLLSQPAYAPPSAPTTTAQPSQSALDQLTASVAALTAAVGQMRSDMEGMRQEHMRSRSRGRSVTRQGRQQQQRSPSRSRFCYYHQRFGAAARKCAEPCSWQQQQPGNDLA